MVEQQYQSLVMNQMVPIEEILKDTNKTQYQNNMYNPYPASVTFRE